MNLTPRETQTLLLICKGRTTKEIADSLSVSLKTVEKFRQNATRKIGRKNGTCGNGALFLLQFAFRQKLLTFEEWAQYDLT